MCFETIVQENITEILKGEVDYTIEKNRKRGQSDTFTIFDSSNNPIFIAKFFDFLSEVKDGIGRENIIKYESLEELIEHLDDLQNIPWGIDEVVSYVTLQQRCFKRYVNACRIVELDCFPELIYSVEEIATNDSFYGFLVERYVNGVTLEKKLPFTSEIDKGAMTLEFLMQLAQVIKKLNDNGIVHRDISPDNIMCIEEKYIVIDPGMVKMTDDSSPTQSSMMLGKKFYASPEQYFGHAKSVTFKSDLYAVGIIALEMVLGYNPLKKVIMEERKYQAPHQELLKKYKRDLEDEFFDQVEDNEFNSRLLLIIKKMVQIENRSRYDSIDSFIIALTRLEKRV